MDNLSQFKVSGISDVLYHSKIVNLGLLKKSQSFFFSFFLSFFLSSYSISPGVWFVV